MSSIGRHVVQVVQVVQVEVGVENVSPLAHPPRKSKGSAPDLSNRWAYLNDVSQALLPLYDVVCVHDFGPHTF